MDVKYLDEMFKKLKKEDDPFLFISMDDERKSVMQYGNPPQLLNLLQTGYRELKKSLTLEYGKAAAEAMMSGITMTDEEMQEEAKSGFKRILSDLWKKKWAEEEDDDAEDESEDSDDDSSEDDDDADIEEEAHRKAIAELARALRDAVRDGVDDSDHRDDHRKPRRG